MDSDGSRPAGDEVPLIPLDHLRQILANRGWILALCIIVLGFGLRALSLNAYWINPDEGLGYSIASWSTFAEFWQELQDNAHPPLYYLLLYAMDFFGTDITWFRMLSLVPGCLAIFGVYLLGKEVGGAPVGLVAGFLVAVSPSAIELSQIIRPYMLQVAGLTFSLYFLARYLRTRSSRDLWLYSLFMVVAMLTHYSSLIVMGGIGILLVGLLGTRKIPRTEIGRLLIANVPIGLTMVALSFHLSSLLNSDLQVQAQTHSLSQHWVTGVTSIWINLIGVMRYLFGLGYSGPTILLLLAGLVLAWRRGKYAAFVLPIAVLGLAILGAALRQYPFGISRHVAYLLPIVVVPVAVPVALGLAGSRRSAIATVVVVLGLLLFRVPVSEVIGAGSNRLLATEERILPRENVMALQQKLRQARSSGQPILMGLQTYYSLIPLLDEARGERRWQPGVFFRIPWGQSVILVNIAWKMTTGAVADGSHESFYGFLQRIDGALPELNITEQTAATVLVAGWETGLVGGLLDFGSSRQEDVSEIAVVSDLGLLYMAAMEVDLKKFVDTVRE